MKKIVLFLLFSSFLFAQQKVIVQQKSFGWKQVADHSVLVNADTTDSFYIEDFTGATNLWISFVSVDSIKSDITVKLQLYNSKSNEWAEYYSGGTLFTIPSANVTAGNVFYYSLAQYDQWIWASKARFIFSVSSTSSVTYNVYVGGQ